MSPDPVPVLHVDEIDGVRAVWVDAPGPLRAGLSLRVGVADETLPQRGITHLLEHLALFGIGRPGDHSNGQVNASLAMFMTVGDDQVVPFFDQVTRQFHDLPLARLDDERRVMQAEGARRGSAMADDLLVWRYGAQDYGLLAFDEFGLRSIDGDALAAWAARYATRQNAVLWLSGPPPAGLRLHLPDGQAHPAPDLTRSILPRFPAWLRGPDDGAVLQAVVERGWAIPALAHILRTRLVDELRVRRAVAYSPNVDYSPVTGTHGWLMVGTDAVAGRQTEAIRPFLNALRQLGDPDDEHAVTEADLVHWHETRARDESEPGAALGIAVAAAWELVHGKQPDSAEDRQHQAGAITVEGVAAAARQAFGSVLAQVPSRLGPAGDPWTEAPACLAEPLSGNEFPATQADHDEVLVLAPAGLTLRQGERRATVPVASTAAVLTWEDGRRTLIGADATRITVEPNLIRDGDRLSRLVDEQWPAALRIDLGSRPSGEIPKPAAPQQDRAGRAAAANRSARNGQLLMGLGLAVALLIVLLVIAGIHVPFGPVIGGFLAASLGFAIRQHRRGQ